MYFLGPDEVASMSYALIGLCLCFAYVIVSTLLLDRRARRARARRVRESE